MMKNIEYYRLNAEEDYLTTPISVLAYISHLETFKAKVSELSDPDELYSAGDMQDALEKINELCK